MRSEWLELDGTKSLLKAIDDGIDAQVERWKNYGETWDDSQHKYQVAVVQTLRSVREFVTGDADYI